MRGPVRGPVDPAYLAAQDVSPPFVEYLRSSFRGVVAP